MAAPLRLHLSVSRFVQASVLALHGSAGLALFFALEPFWLRALCTMLILASAWKSWHGEARKAGICLALAGDGHMLLGRTSSALVPVRLATPAMAFAGVAWLVIDIPPVQASPARRWRVMLVRANVCGDQWRQLQIWLRHRSLSASVLSA
ncbi:hypothetical protein J5J83_06255 [Azoarcus sp. L1K30]|uniref:hypothetical protein n=1 Tax=Azoarcus sp. L1K30 TaxID=2820277 RepID=UPI001B83D565|nr:hypothetical protein [Azoarcus sp. L1K30]MBR0565715.1 hypothetical protein [Azoarcus sp. L1K30]